MSKRSLTPLRQQVLEFATEGKPRAWIARRLSMTKNSVASTISQLRRAGYEIPYLRAGAPYHKSTLIKGGLYKMEDLTDAGEG